jgi:ABC-type lipoprotein export system ATPase subunit
VWDLILSLNKGEFKQTFVIVTHDVEAAQAADQIFELVNGILIPA